MKRIRLIFGLIAALLAFVAIAPVAAAVEKTLILPEPTMASPISGSGTSGEGIIETVSGKTLKCRKTKAAGSFTTPNMGTGSVLFEECTSALETVCTGEGDSQGSVEVSGTAYYVLALEMLSTTTSTLIPAFATIIPQFHLVCSNREDGIELLVLKRGCIAGRADGGEGLVSSVTVLSERFTKGEPRVLSILMPDNTKEETKCLLEVSISEEKTGEHFELAVLVGSFLSSSFKRAGGAVTVLLMDK